MLIGGRATTDQTGYEQNKQEGFQCSVRVGCNQLSPEEGIDAPCSRQNGATHIPVEQGTRVVSALLK